MVFDQNPTDRVAYDNTVTLVHTVWEAGDDSLTDYHGGSGTILFFDVHVDMMLRKDFLEQTSTEEGTLRLWGGHMDWHW